jgi:type IV secretory pathway VirB2 component (pilin)
MKKTDLKILFLMLLLAAAAPLFAQDLMPQGMTKLADNVMNIFTGDFVRVIMIICLAGCAVAYGFNKDNEKMKRNIIAIAVAIGIIVGASTVVGKIWDAAK